MPSPNPPPGDRSEQERLQRTLARAGYGSRRSVEALIRERRVRVDGTVAVLGDRVDPLRSQITLDGVPIPAHPRLRYLAFNKPAGVTSTMGDRHAARGLGEFVPPGPRVFPVGRLDRESEGLMLLTNDGDLALRIQHPRYGVQKEYLVEVEGEVSRRAVNRLVRGVRLEDRPARAHSARIVQHRPTGTAALLVVMVEGRKREVRRMLREVELTVHRLVRVRIGPIFLRDLAPGETRDLVPDEVTALYRMTGLARANPTVEASQPRP